MVCPPPSFEDFINFVDSLKEPARFRSRPERISRLEAVTFRFPGSLFGFRRAEVLGYRDRVVALLGRAEAGDKVQEAPPARLRRALIGVSPRVMAEFVSRVEMTLRPTPR